MKLQSEYYLLADGSTVNREYGKTPNGNRLNGAWVYRNKYGDLVDFDMYRNDLLSRNHIEED